MSTSTKLPGVSRVYTAKTKCFISLVVFASASKYYVTVLGRLNSFLDTYQASFAAVGDISKPLRFAAGNVYVSRIKLRKSNKEKNTPNKGLVTLKQIARCQFT